MAEQALGVIQDRFGRLKATHLASAAEMPLALAEVGEAAVVDARFDR
ncbi:MAG TPA: hypothetical protein VMU42_12900 [Candidatus Sulfotelmatobacter sp.]|nr:hypothetical protein [Candidatus Sulfotelmatobacter sp.]